MAETIVLNGQDFKIIYRYLKDLGPEDLKNTIEEAIENGNIENYIIHKNRKKEYNTPKLNNTSVVTVCEIYQNLRRPYVAIGHAFCNKKDQFNKRIGRSIAKNRAIRSLNFYC